jgi:CRP-like cAMP-binding protein
VNEKKKICVCENCEFRDVVFSYLDDSSIEELCNNKEEQSFRKGEVINHEGEKISNFKYLKSGLVKLYRRTSTGEEQVITITRPFEFVSNMSIFSEERYQYSVSALEDSVVCLVRLEFIKELFMKNGGFAMGLLTKISMINDKIISQTLDIRQKNLIGRVAFVLLYFTNDIYNSRVFDLPVSRKEIADYIGMSTANVIRTMSDFKKEGIIRVFGKTIEIVDLNKLEIISKLSASSSLSNLKLYPALMIFRLEIQLPLSTMSDISPITALRIQAGTGGRKRGMPITAAIVLTKSL